MGAIPGSVPKIISALAARTQLGQIMRRARVDQARFVVDRRGEPQIVIMGIKDFLKTIAPEKHVVAAIRAAARIAATTCFSGAMVLRKSLMPIITICGSPRRSTTNRA